MRRPNSLVSVRAMTQKVISPGLSAATPTWRVNELALRRQDRRDRDQILLLDIGIAQRKFERGQLLAMDADAAGEEEALGKWKHCSSIIRAPA